MSDTLVSLVYYSKYHYGITYEGIKSLVSTIIVSLFLSVPPHSTNAVPWASLLSTDCVILSLA